MAPIISVITQIEALSWINPDKTKEAIVKDFINDAVVIGLDKEIVQKAIMLRRNRKIKTPDAIIAATAIVHQFILLTMDNGFNNIPDLKVINPDLVA